MERSDPRIGTRRPASDGRPQDHGYGRDRTEKEYAIHDTKMALNEAKRTGIVPFALTVDRAGHDYLKTSCEDRGDARVAGIEALPSRLPTRSRMLTGFAYSVSKEPWTARPRNRWVSVDGQRKRRWNR